MDDSILDTIKKMLGIDPTVTAFDTDIIVLINSAFLPLNQIGIGPVEGYSISGSSGKWSEYTTDIDNLESVKSYIYLKVKTIFDPPSSSYVLQQYTQTIKELEWRLCLEGEAIPHPDNEQYYDGEYTITPKSYTQMLETNNKKMRDDVDVEAIPYLQASNNSGGLTTIIGDE